MQFGHTHGAELVLRERCPGCRDRCLDASVHYRGRREARRGPHHQDHAGDARPAIIAAWQRDARGSHGFRFGGRKQSGNEPSNYCGPVNPCQPGATIAFTATWLGSDLPGTVRLQGDEFAVGLEPASMSIELTGSFVAPAHLADTASVTVPFAASGGLAREYPFPPFQLTGGGDVTFTLEWQPAIGGWAIRFSSFDFGGGGRPD